MSRSAWHIRTSAVVLAWLTAAAVAAAMHRQLPAATWLMVHLLLLGAVTTALLVWSWHFSVAVLRAPQSPTRRGEAVRITTANLGALGVVAGVLANTPAVTILGAVAVAAAVAAHVGALVIRLRRALPSRFAFTVRAYVAAGLLLIPGIALGVLMARGTWDATTYSQLLLGHVTINLLGWVGLPILGTLVTLWPTMLHTRLAPDAERQARRALPLLIGGTLVTTAGALTGLDLLAAAGVAGYLLGIGLTVAPMVTEMRQRPPAVFASWSALAGVVWLSGTLVAFGIALVSGSADALSRLAGQLVAAALIGGVLQVLLGSLSYLVPVMVGGGPAAMRRRNARVDRAMAPRLVMLNAALAVCVLPSPSAVRVLASTLVLVAVGWTILLIADSLRPSPGDTAPTTADSPTARPALHHSGGAVVALAIVLLAVVGGVAYDPAAVGAAAVSAAPASAGVTPTGETTAVTVTIEGMRFTPQRIQVPAGNTLTVTVVNSGDDVHDLVLETGQRTPRLSPGQTATIDVGLVGRSLEGWCSVAGHRQMGMVLSIEAIGGTDAALAAADEMPAGHDGHDSAPVDAPVTADQIDLMAEPGPDAATYDPRLPPGPRHPRAPGAPGGDRGRGRGRPRRPPDPMDVRRHRPRTRPARQGRRHLHRHARERRQHRSLHRLPRRRTRARRADAHHRPRRDPGVPVHRDPRRDLDVPLLDHADVHAHRQRHVRCRHHRPARPRARRPRVRPRPVRVLPRATGRNGIGGEDRGRASTTSSRSTATRCSTTTNR